MRLTKNTLKRIIRGELKLTLQEKKKKKKKKKKSRKASKTVGEPPYREQGATESQAQQKAAGMAYSCRKKRGEERTKCANKLKKRKGAAYSLYKGEITYKQLRNLAKLGQKVKKHKSKEPKHLKSLPGHVTKAMAEKRNYRGNNDMKITKFKLKQLILEELAKLYE